MLTQILESDHAFSILDLGTPSWACPHCELPSSLATRQVETLTDLADELERQLLDTRRRLDNYRRRVKELGFGQQLEGSQFSGITPAIGGGPSSPSQRFTLNPLTAIHGEFVPGAHWKPDQRSRKERAIERNQIKAKEAKEVRVIELDARHIRIQAEKLAGGDQMGCGKPSPSGAIHTPCRCA